jgi:putative CocE/NonD family hydrolase
LPVTNRFNTIAHVTWGIIRIMRRDVGTHPVWLVIAAALITSTAVGTSRAQAPAPAQAPLTGVDLVRSTYTKYEYRVPMRDGVRLFTAVYVPKNDSQRYPVLITRTPYSVSPYGVDQYPAQLGPSDHFQKEGFIFVYQDARGRYMSEGEFQQVRPFNPWKGPKDIDESTDTYDTIEWLLKNIPNNNGRAGMIGISQPGFHVAASIINSHPALKAASPQAPTADYYMGDDVYHNGAFMLGANFGFYSAFVARGAMPEPPKPAIRFDPGTPDMYDFFLGTPVPLARMNADLFGGKAAYWQEIVDHTTYDEFWKKRSLWRFMDGVKCAVLNVGGWFDAEDPVGPLKIYRAVEEKNPGITNILVMGPWSHGGWARGTGVSLGNLNFGVRTSEYFRENIQFPFFMQHLKDKPASLPEAWLFLTGVNEFRRLNEWPPKTLQPTTLYFNADGGLSRTSPAGQREFDEYVSDPNRPVPYVSYTAPGMTADYMTEDQRFASRRTDVLVYQTPPLDHDMIIAGPVKVNLHVSTTGTDSDFVVKLVDVYPNDYPTPAAPAGQPVRADAVKMGGYQQLVRGEPFRGKYRKSFEKPEPFVAGEPALIAYELPDVYHAFRKGHRVMVQVQSSWFPLVDRNPQVFMEIPTAKPSDFKKATQRVYRSGAMASSITVMVQP